MAADDLKIYKKYIDFLEYSINVTKKYPKSETFCLVKEIRELIYKGLSSLIYAIKVFSIKEKLKHLFELDVILSILKIHIRNSYKFKYISNQNYAFWSNSITDIGNMLGGWISACQKK